jgi:uncharacterized protein HemY
MLLESNDAPAALKEFEATLVNEPNRFRTLYGAARAAAQAGNEAAAKRYFARLVSICDRAGMPARPELLEARAAVAR